MAKRGRKRIHPAKIGVYVKVKPDAAERIESARWKKGLTQGEYWERLIALGDKQIPNLPPDMQKQLRLKFFAYPIRKNGECAA